MLAKLKEVLRLEKKITQMSDPDDPVVRMRHAVHQYEGERTPRRHKKRESFAPRDDLAELRAQGKL